MAAQRRRAGAGGAGLRDVPRLAGGDSRTSAGSRTCHRRPRAFVDALERLAGVPIGLVSVGPERTQTIVRAGRVDRADRPGRRVTVHVRRAERARPSPRRRLRWPGARACLAADATSRRRTRAGGAGQPGHGRRRPRRARSRPDDARGHHRPRPARRPSISWSSARRRRSWTASPTSCRHAGLAVFGPAGGGPHRGQQDLLPPGRRRRRRAHGRRRERSPTRLGASPSRRASTVGSRSRRTGWRRGKGVDRLRDVDEARPPSGPCSRACLRGRRPRVVVEALLQGREASVIAHLRRHDRSGPARRRATTNASARATPVRTPAAWARISPLDEP